MDVNESPLLKIIHELLAEHSLLEEYLINEKAVLAELNIDSMVAIGQEKQKVLAKIAGLEKSLMNLLSLSSTYALREKVEESIQQESVDNQTLAEKNWRELTALVKRCKDLNKVNMAIVNTSLDHTRKKQNILYSLAQTGIYDEKGTLS